MKKNFNHITMILTLTFAYNIQTLTTACHFSADREQIRKQDEEKIKRTEAEIEGMLIYSEIPEPHFENPALWKVLIRQYGIQLFYTCFNIKTWLMETYNSIKEVIYENPKNETI